MEPLLVVNRWGSSGSATVWSVSSSELLELSSPVTWAFDECLVLPDFTSDKSALSKALNFRLEPFVDPWDLVRVCRTLVSESFLRSAGSGVRSLTFKLLFNGCTDLCLLYRSLRSFPSYVQSPDRIHGNFPRCQLNCSTLATSFLLSSYSC